ncbi:MAG: DUF423 domain-containing protein [Phycisphaeraceae bacterium]|nr:DUF423 domain-containing protein [Phycisphaeraceae bacterium]
MDPLFMSIGAFSALIAVAFGGARAHLLEKRLPRDRLPMLEVGMRYQVVHSMGILFAAIAMAQFGGPAAMTAAIAFTCGIVLFSGSMYCFALTGIRAPMRLTPVAGIVFVIGWAALALSPIFA